MNMSALVVAVVTSTPMVSACGLPPIFTVVSTAADFASYGTTGKTVTDHGISFVLQQDCSMMRILDSEKPLCVEETAEDETTVVSETGNEVESSTATRDPESLPQDLPLPQEEPNRVAAHYPVNEDGFLIAR